MVMTDPAPDHNEPKVRRLGQLGEGILQTLRDLNGVRHTTLQVEHEPDRLVQLDSTRPHHAG